MALGGWRRLRRRRSGRRHAPANRRGLGLLPVKRCPRDCRGTRLGEPDAEARLAGGGRWRLERRRTRRRADAPERRALGLLPDERPAGDRGRAWLGEPAAQPGLAVGGDRRLRFGRRGWRAAAARRWNVATLSNGRAPRGGRGLVRGAAVRRRFVACRGGRRFHGRRSGRRAAAARERPLASRVVDRRRGHRAKTDAGPAARMGLAAGGRRRPERRRHR